MDSETRELWMLMKEYCLSCYNSCNDGSAYREPKEFYQKAERIHEIAKEILSKG